MEDLIVKNVDVMGDSIKAAKDAAGNIWVGVRWVCDALDMTEGQMKRQIKNIKKDMVFEKEGSNQIPLPTEGGIKEVFCIRNDFVPLWLAKIQITEKTREERPEFANKLMQYQLKAKDILADAFLPKNPQLPSDPMQLLELHYQALKQVDRKVEEVDGKVGAIEGRLANLENTMNLDYGQQRDLGDAVAKTVMKALGGESPAYKEIGRKVFAECNHDLKAYFRVNARANIPKKRYEDAIYYAENWKPCTNTQMRIDQANAQMALDLK